MEGRRVSPLVTASVTIALCGVCGGVFNIIRRAFHLFDFAREAAHLDADFTDPAQWKDAAVSVYDIAVIFNLSSGIIAAAEMVAGAVGLIYALRHYFGKKPLSGARLPYFLGIVCTLVGAVSSVSLIISRSSSVFFTLTLVIIQLVVPIIFTVTVAQFHKERKNL